MAYDTHFAPDLFAPLSEGLGNTVEATAHAWGAQQRAGTATGELAWQHAQRLGGALTAHAQALGEQASQLQQQAMARTFNPWQWGLDWAAYATDALQRQALVLDTLRQRGNTAARHEAAGMPPVLNFNYEVLIDGRELDRPVNYSLLRIVAPAGVRVDPAQRPFMIIDPRAGHGAGIGGFKPDSQVGEAFADGHPVYFVSFSPQPQPGQTLVDVRDAEVQFVQEVARLHPQAPKPAVIGNCQGGWASMLLAATVPELVGPVVINGAPMSYWAGKVGVNPMRYMGGLAGGALPALLMSDLGDGVFDGSALVANFENLNPANSLFGKLYKLYSQVDTEAERYLEFERWWGGYFLMNEAEIRWIVENLFIGNRLARGDAVLGDEHIDLRRIQSPIIVFASHGDNITPPQQALNWIADLYVSEAEITARGQRIVYMLHQSIGHLGIFVSSQIAGREHEAITDTIRAIEALPPGLYEMKLDDARDRVHIRYEPRTIADILALDDGRDDELMFASVARLSEIATDLYEMTVRPLVRAAVTPSSARLLRQAQPLRQRRQFFSDSNPLMAPVATWAGWARQQRAPVDAANPCLALERHLAEDVQTRLDLYRDWRDALGEITFHALYGAPALRAVGERDLARARHRRSQELRSLPAVREALRHMTVGGAAEGMVRMLLLMAKARGYLRRSRLEHLAEGLDQHPLLGHLDAQARGQLLYRQTVLVSFEPEQALQTLPQLLETEAERHDALALVREVSGAPEGMHPAARTLYRRFEALLTRAGATPQRTKTPTKAPSRPRGPRRTRSAQ